MSFLYSAGVITQTGTDTDLSGLNGLTGVTVTSYSSRYSVYALGTNRLDIDGDLTINPEENMFISNAPTGQVPNMAVNVRNGATLTLGVKTTVGTANKYTTGTAFILAEPGNLNVNGSLHVESGGTFQAFGATIQMAGPARILSGATLTVEDLTLVNCRGSNCQFRIEGSNVTHNALVSITKNGMTLNGVGSSDSCRLTTISNNNTFDSNSFIFNFVRAQYQPAAGGYPSQVFLNFDNGKNIDSADFAYAGSGGTGGTQFDGDLVDFRNVARRLRYTNANSAGGFCKTTKNINFNLQDANGTGLSTVSYYAVDVDNGSRINFNGFDSTADITYSGQNAGPILSLTPVVEYMAGESTTRYIDSRTNGDDTIQFQFISYATNITTSSPILIGLGNLEPVIVNATDSFITESRATVDAYTTIDNAQELYDKIKSYLVDNFAVTSARGLAIISRSGNQVILDNKNLVIDATAGGAFTYLDPTITIKSSDFTGGATATTGSVTTLNGALLSGGTFDCDVNCQSGAGTTLTNVTVNGVLDFNTAGTYTLDGCTITEVTNSSGGVITLSLTNGSTVTTNTGPLITINNDVNLTVDSLQTGSNVRIEKQLDGSLISQGPESGGSYTDTYNFTANVPVKIIVRLHGCQTNEFLGTITSSGLAATANQLVDSFVVANYATASAYTGITENFSAQTVTLAEDHTIQEIYDYLNAKASDLTNLQYDTMISTVNGIVRTGVFNLTVDTTNSLNATDSTSETLDLGANTLTLSGTGTYGDPVIIIHSAGTNKTLKLNNVISGRNYRIEKQSDQSMVYEGTASGTSVSIKHLWTSDLAVKLITGQYGYNRFDTLFTLDNAYQQTQVSNTTDPYVVATEAGAGAITGISLTYSTATGTITQARTVQELYDYERHEQAELSNLTYEPLLNTNSGLTINLDMYLTVSTGGTLSSTTQAINADADSVVTQSGGSITCALEVVTGSQLISNDIDSITGSLILSGTGDWEIEAQGTAPIGASSANASIEVTTANPADVFDFSAFIFDAGTVLENSSGNNITVNILPGATLPTKLETSGTITFTANATVTAVNISDGSRAQLWNITKGAELDNSVVSGGGGYSFDVDTALASADAGDTLRLRVTYQSGTNAKLPLEMTGTLTTTGLSFVDSQEDDTVYNSIGLDGSTITKLEADYLNDEIDIVTATDFAGHELYARFVYFTTIEEGIRNFYGGFEAVDLANFKNDVSAVDLYLNNITATNIKQTDNVRLYKSDEGYPVRNPTTGGGGIDVVWRSQVFFVNDSEITAIKAQTDKMQFNGSNEIAAQDSSTIITDIATLQTTVDNLNDPTAAQIATEILDNNNTV